MTHPHLEIHSSTSSRIGCSTKLRSTLVFEVSYTGTTSERLDAVEKELRSTFDS